MQGSMSLWQGQIKNQNQSVDETLFGIIEHTKNVMVFNKSTQCYEVTKFSQHLSKEKVYFMKFCLHEWGTDCLIRSKSAN